MVTGLRSNTMHRWSEVQRTWSYLESIFIGSEDIRAQLPEDSSRFDIVDKDFKVLMVEMAKTPNVVKATNAEGLPEKLLELMQSLSKCEKALAEYLETKRLAFPRLIADCFVFCHSYLCHLHLLTSFQKVLFCLLRGPARHPLQREQPSESGEAFDEAVRQVTALNYLS